MRFPTSYYSFQIFHSLIKPSKLNTGRRRTQRPGHFFPNEKEMRSPCSLSFPSSPRNKSEYLLLLLTQSWQPHILLSVNSMFFLLEIRKNMVKIGKIIFSQDNEALHRDRVHWKAEESTNYYFKIFPKYVLHIQEKIWFNRGIVLRF